MSDINEGIKHLPADEKFIGEALIEFWETMKGLENDPHRGGKRATKIVMTMNDITKHFGTTASWKESLKKYGQHLRACNINQNWDDAAAALADTPTEFRDEGYTMACRELDEKRKKCTCGFHDLIK